MNINRIFIEPPRTGKLYLIKPPIGVSSSAPFGGIFLKMENEIWKEIPGYEGMYQVSSFGKVKSLSRVILNRGKHPFVNKERVLKQNISSHGYYDLTLSKNGKTSRKTVHSLVALAFLGFIGGSRRVVIDHIDNDKLNNNVNNLQIVTNRYNSSKDRQRDVTKHTGISWYELIKKWKVSFGVNGKVKHLGYFDNEHDAHLAYQKEALKELEELQKINDTITIVNQ